MSPISLLEPSLIWISGTTGETKPLEDQVLALAEFAAWLGGAALILLLGRAVGGAQKDMVNYLLDKATPEQIPVRIPLTRPERRTRYA